MGTLGERFILYRVEVEDPKNQARRRLANQGRETEMRADLSAAVRGVLDHVDRGVSRRLHPHDTERLVVLSAFVVWARTPVDRDGYSRDVVAMPSREAPARLAESLGIFAAGLQSIGADHGTRWRIVDKTAWDCVPPLRRELLETLNRGGRQSSAQLTEATGIPKTTADRTLEDLALLGLVARHKAGEHKTAAWVYELSDEAHDSWLPSFPRNVGRVELVKSHNTKPADSGGLLDSDMHDDDKSGVATSPVTGIPLPGPFDGPLGHLADAFDFEEVPL